VAVIAPKRSAGTSKNIKITDANLVTLIPSPPYPIAKPSNQLFVL